MLMKYHLQCATDNSIDIVWHLMTCILYCIAAANIGEDLLRSLSRDDIKDLFPGPENFLRRRALWLLVNNDEQVCTVF